jgi:predicted nuclease of predicted toxin-antitoxin system
MPADTARLLRIAGYECCHVSELGMQKAEDEDILSFAIDHEWVVITLDADFHAILAVRGLRKPSVVRLRREGCRADVAFGILNPLLKRYGLELAQGALISIKEHKVTCHLLPVGRDR